MTIAVIHEYCADEQDALSELSREGFKASTVDYAPGRTEPHQHEYDICLHIIEGEFRVTDVDEGVVHNCGPGTKLSVSSGTRHFEDHDAVKMVVGRRHQT